MWPDPICTRCGAICREGFLSLRAESGLTWSHRKVTICEHCRVALDGFLNEFSDQMTESALGTDPPTTTLRTAAQACTS